MQLMPQQAFQYSITTMVGELFNRIDRSQHAFERASERADQMQSSLNQQTDMIATLTRRLDSLERTQQANTTAITTQGNRLVEELTTVQRAVPVIMHNIDQNAKILMEQVLHYCMNTAYGLNCGFMLWANDQPSFVIGCYGVSELLQRLFGGDVQKRFRDLRRQQPLFDAMSTLGTVLQNSRDADMVKKMLRLLPYHPTTIKKWKATRNFRVEKANECLVAMPMCKFMYVAKATLDEAPFTQHNPPSKHPATHFYTSTSDAVRFFLDSLEPGNHRQRGAWNYRWWTEVLANAPLREYVQFLRLYNSPPMPASVTCSCATPSTALRCASVTCERGLGNLVLSAKMQCVCSGNGRCGVCDAIMRLARLAKDQVRVAVEQEQKLSVNPGALPEDTEVEPCRLSHFSGLTLLPDVRIYTHAETVEMVKLLRKRHRSETERRRHTNHSHPYLHLEDEPELYLLSNPKPYDPPASVAPPSKRARARPVPPADTDSDFDIPEAEVEAPPVRPKRPRAATASV